MAFNYFGSSLNHAASYTKFRPIPPTSLIQAIKAFLAEKNTDFKQAVDVGCGSGQSTTLLAPHFETVIGVDGSEEIIQEANAKEKQPNVQFRLSRAENLPVDSDSSDLVTAVQAAHWFNLPQFYSEAKRILKKNGVLAIYGYNLPEPVGNEPSAQLIKHYYAEVLKDYVFDESRKVYLNNYRDLEFNQVPFIESGLMKREEYFTTEILASVSDITNYISTWSGFQNMIKKEGEEESKRVLQEFQTQLIQKMGKNCNDTFPVQYRYFLLMGRKISE